MRVNRLTVNSPKMHTSPTHIQEISIYIFIFNKVRKGGGCKKRLLTVNLLTSCPFVKNTNS